MTFKMPEPEYQVWTSGHWNVVEKYYYDSVRNESMKRERYTADQLRTAYNAGLEDAALKAENTALKADAERYRFCFTSDDFAVCNYEGNTPFCEDTGGWTWMYKDEADNRIDAARAALGVNGT